MKPAWNYNNIASLPNYQFPKLCEIHVTQMVQFPFNPGLSNHFIQRASYKFKNIVRAAYKKLMIIQTLNDEPKLSLY